MFNLNKDFSNVFINVILALLFLATLPKAIAQAVPANYQTCIACHGEQGQGNPSLNAPVLAGQLAEYTVRQLNNFVSGSRGAHPKDIHGQSMATIAKVITAEDIKVIAEYLAQQTPPEQDISITGDMKNGSRYYQAKCGACHGGQAQGNDAFSAPKLASQDIEYLKRQMQNFVEGVRGTEKEDKYGRQMAMMAKTVSAQELNDIMFYIASQK